LLSMVEDRRPEKLGKTRGYLESKASELKERWQARGCAIPSVKCIAAYSVMGAIAGGILRFAEDNGADLIMLSTHGRSGIQRWLMGSVAEKVLRGSDMPLLLARASTEPAGAPREMERLLVPLDGSELAERALPYAQHLAKSGSAEVTVLYVEQLQDVDSLSGRPVSGFEAHQGEETELYLYHISYGLSSQGIKAQVRVRGGHPAEQVTEEAREGATDLIVMSSHGRTGLARWAFGSTADQVIRTSPAPVLLVPSQVSGPVPPHLQGPLVYRCHHCGRRTYPRTFTSQDRCPRCQYFFKACGNCIHFAGTGCILGLPYAGEVYPGNRCPQFDFRKTRLVLR
jgi:nucleotide-binding universal stress UspA family protein